MKIALSAARFQNNDIQFNFAQMKKWSQSAKSLGADLICFGEAFLQGFDSLKWDYQIDQFVAITTNSNSFRAVSSLSRDIGIDILFGFIERDGDVLYSSCALVSEGRLNHLYRRISRGWKEFRHSDGHYREGPDPQPFFYRGLKCAVALCGDLWDFPEKFALGEDLLFWPVYVSYTPEEWETQRPDYARQAALSAPCALLCNSLDPDAYGGCSVFLNGRTAASLPTGQEGILIWDTPSNE